MSIVLPFGAKEAEEADSSAGTVSEGGSVGPCELDARVGALSSLLAEASLAEASSELCSSLETAE